MRGVPFVPRYRRRRSYRSRYCNIRIIIIHYNIGDAPDLTQRLLCPPRGEHEDTPCQINGR